MAIPMFDTHRFIRKLQESGFNEGQAETLSDAFNEAQDIYLQKLVTKEDLKGVKQSIKDVKQDLKDVEQSLNNKIDNVEQSLNNKIDKLELTFSGEMKLIKWMLGILIAINMSVAVKLLFL